jgi:hypothetical protein
MRFDGRLDRIGISSAEGDYGRDIPLARAFENERVSLFQTVDSECQPAQPVGGETVHTGLKKHDIRLKLPDPRKRFGQFFKIRRIGGQVGKFDIDRTFLFSKREIQCAVHGKRQDVLIAFENRGGAVALMDIEIDNGRAADPVLVQQAADRNRNVIKHTKTGSFRTESVMGAAGKAARDAGMEGITCRLQSTARGCENALDQTLRPWKSDAAQRRGREAPIQKRSNVARIVRELKGIEGSLGRGPQIENSVRFERFPKHPVFAEREFMPGREGNFVTIAVINSQFTPIRCE